ncbi:hypothetical protein CspeluHIS016_0209710 [Cutaneotrichosporon spelunceum]|uniref:Uncharacterized protein n=1 Tax=Cutaneotrichosporon spelunceum TaxID=1672016 RepID=A0AAD3TT26_9TREE|nr:hypothetical protein CspeluHIS016_0209710 [Cutaneotrichosporon spelunceum]
MFTALTLGFPVLGSRHEELPATPTTSHNSAQRLAFWFMAPSHPPIPSTQTQRLFAQLREENIALQNRLAALGSTTNNQEVNEGDTVKKHSDLLQAEDHEQDICKLRQELLDAGSAKDRLEQEVCDLRQKLNDSNEDKQVAITYSRSLLKDRDFNKRLYEATSEELNTAEEQLRELQERTEGDREEARLLETETELRKAEERGAVLAGRVEQYRALNYEFANRSIQVERHRQVLCAEITTLKERCRCQQTPEEYRKAAEHDCKKSRLADPKKARDTLYTHGNSPLRQSWSYEEGLDDDAEASDRSS